MLGGGPEGGGRSLPGYGVQPHGRRGWLVAYKLSKTTASGRCAAVARASECECESESRRCVGLSVQQRKNVTTEQRKQARDSVAHRPYALAVAFALPRWP